MTTLNLPLDDYDAAIGVDLKFDISGDLALDSLDGDLATVSGAASMSESIRRRITTPFEGYARLVKTTENTLDPIGLGYGSNAASYLSNPITNVGLSDDLAADINDAVNQDRRVQVSQTYISEVTNTQSKLGLVLNYRLYEPNSLAERRLSVGEFSIAGLTIGTISRNQQLIIPVEG